MTDNAQPGAPRLHLPWWAGRVGLLVALVSGAYWLSLATLWRDLGGQTPLAFIGLAPWLAAGLLMAGLARREPLPHPGRVDLVTGLGLVGAAGAILVVAPSLASVYFWTARIDVASLPLFAGGALILLFGWRVLFVARGALVLLLLAWPLPYLVLLENTSVFLTDVTAGALAVITAVVPVARLEPGDEAVFTVLHGTDPFRVQVAAACAGLNSTVAFLLVGSAFVLLLRGSVPRKAAWFATGLLVVFAFNVIRVVLLVVVGALFGEAAAIDMFHPVAGMLALAAGVVVMLLLLSRFGLTPPDLRPAPPVASPLPAPRSHETGRRSLAARAALLAAVAMLFGVVNGTFAAYEQGPDGAPAASMIRPTVRTLGGWSVRSERDVTIGRPYYGTDSTWTRYRLRPDRASQDAQYNVWLDNVSVTDRQRLVDFGPEKCYRFHGHTIDAAEQVALGRGVVGRVLAITRTDGKPWVILWWEWPVEDRDGHVRHDRITLLASTTVRPTTKPLEVDGQPLLLPDFGPAIPPDLEPLANDLIALGSGIVTDLTAPTAASR